MKKQSAVMRSFKVTITGPQRYLCYFGLYRSSVDAAIASTHIARTCDRVKVEAA